jgi:hypothetical protein
MSVPKGNKRFWVSGSGSPNTQWVQLTFPVPVTVRTVRLYNPSNADSSIQVLDATVRLYSDAGGIQEVASNNSGALSAQGTNVNFNEVLARVIRIQFNSVNGNAAALGEVEVIARGESPNATGSMTATPVPVFTATSTPTSIPANTSTPALSGPFVSTDVNPTNINIGGTALVSVRLNNVPVDGYKSAEFTCTYNAGLVEKSDIDAANLFGADAAVAIHENQTGTFIVAIAGTNGNKATISGPAFTFSTKGLQAGQSPIQCTARVSKGDNVPIDLPSTGANLTIGVEPSPTPFGFPTATSDNNQQPTATNVPLGSPTPTASFTPLPSPDGSLTGQVIASKPVTVSLSDANNVVVTSAAANPDGTFSLTALAGNYTVVATASGFLSHQGSAVLTAGNTTARPTINLLAGDIDGNNVIDQFDALTIGMSYTTSSPAAADLNNDGTIDFLDLELLAENYRKTGPSVWE